jgi:phosphatidylserine/phosphatidylglycerophosphate/cardiolipin synthase-like enzyme
MLKRYCIALIIMTGGLSPYAFAEGWWQVFFTEPERNRHGGEYSSPERAIIMLFDSAKISIDGAFYEIGSQKVAAAFIRAQARGVRVRIVSDGQNRKVKGALLLAKHSVPIVFDTQRGFMHDKFAIVDGRYVWTGSYNITDNCAYHNNNNAIFIDSPDLAAIYDAEFEEMFVDRIFKNRKERTPLPALRNPYYVKIGDVNINAYFSPDNNVEDIIVKRIRKARSSICFLAFSFTSDPIGEAMIDQAKKGVRVEGILEKRGSDSSESEYNKFRVEGISVRVDKNPKNMHHKVIIIDERIVITGSYNFSKNASRRNDENILIIDSAEIAQKYLAEYRRL